MNLMPLDESIGSAIPAAMPIRTKRNLLKLCCPCIDKTTLRLILAGEIALSRIPQCTQTILNKIRPRFAVWNCGTYTPFYPELLHPLSSWIIKQGMRRLFLNSRSTLEHQILESNLPTILAIVNQTTSVKINLLKAISIINQEFTQSNYAVRSVKMFLSSTPGASEIEMPDADLLDDHFRRADAFLSELEDDSIIVRAVFLLVLILNAHPFLDGNGRTARAIFNGCLIGAGATGYVPLYEIAHYSLGGFELSLREAEITGNWNPILRYIIMAIRISAE